MDLVDMPEPEQREPVVISYEMALKGLKAAIEVKGADYVYQPFETTTMSQGACRYFDQQAQPSCIVGHVLDSLGVAPFRFEQPMNAVGVAMLESRGVIAYDQDDWEKTGKLLYYAQRRQDRGTPWGAAVDEAIAAAECEVGLDD